MATIRNRDLDTRFLVLAMGVRGIGYLRHLPTMVTFNGATVLNVGLERPADVTPSPGRTGQLVADLGARGSGHA
ncbi:hypothetical protein ACWC0C_42380 [Streptomyces sp. NPDC001709]